jgi:acetyl esterase/lipase
MKLILQITLLLISQHIFAQKSSGVELVYGHKDGMALTMIMLKPESNINGKAIINIVSGSWFSSYSGALKNEAKMAIYLQHGYTVFNVIHGSQPRYNMLDALSDIKRSVRFIRYNAKEFNINPNQLGIIGESSGGHLALLVATTGAEGKINANDSIETMSDQVQAVAVLFPPTDFLNYGEAGFSPVSDESILKEFGVVASFDFKKWNDQKQSYDHPTPEELMKIARDLSPIYNVSADDAPALIIHGDADNTVPIQQSISMIAAYQKLNVPNSFVVKKGAGHGWKNIENEQMQFINWFEQYLK